MSLDTLFLDIVLLGGFSIEHLDSRDRLHAGVGV